MECSEVRKQLPGLSLGDLDAEPARAVQDHLKTCDACRVESARLAATVRALESAPPAAPSSERRNAAVIAMSRAQAEEAERFLAAKPRRWVPRGFAAGILILVAAAASLLLGSPTGMELSVAELSGRADVCRADTGRWLPLGTGDVVGTNDRVITHGETFVRFQLESGTERSRVEGIG